jgi:beta-carotene ketolase (CrtO type)
MHRMEDAPGGLDGYRFSLQSMRSWCDETFESDEAKCLFGAFAPFVGHGPDDAAGAEIRWLLASVLQADGNKLVRGGMQQVSLALAAELETLGGEIRTGARVEQIEVESGRATAVILEGGERVAVGTLVAASIHPAQLALRLLGEEIIGTDAAKRARRIEWGEAVLVIYAALDGPVEYAAGTEAGAAAHVHLSAASLDAMARASDQCRRRASGGTGHRELERLRDRSQPCSRRETSEEIRCARSPVRHPGRCDGSGGRWRLGRCT